MEQWSSQRYWFYRVWSPKRILLKYENVTIGDHSAVDVSDLKLFCEPTFHMPIGFDHTLMGSSRNGMKDTANNCHPGQEFRSLSKVNFWKQQENRKRGWKNETATGALFHLILSKPSDLKWSPSKMLYTSGNVNSINTNLCMFHSINPGECFLVDVWLILGRLTGWEGTDIGNI